MRIIYFSLLFFILTTFIFIQLISIYGESNSLQINSNNLFQDGVKSANVPKGTIQSVENPSQKLIINQQNNVGIEACTGSSPSLICTILEGDTFSFPIECASPGPNILVQCVATSLPDGSSFDQGPPGNPAQATFRWVNANPPGNYTATFINVCVNEACQPSPVLTIKIIVNGTKSGYIERAFEKICQDPNTDFSTLNALELIFLNKKISAAYASYYFEKPEAFKWAGMASYASSLVGYGLAGSELLHLFTKVTNNEIPESTELFNALRVGNTELYRDIGWQHEAFNSEGLAALERIRNQGGLPNEQFESWKKIDEGLRTKNPQLVQEGNKGLLEYEQKKFLQPLVYDPHKELWADFTKSKFPLFSPINPYFFPTFQMHINGKNPGTVPNIGNPEQRWDWVSESMLKRYQSLESKQQFLHDQFLRERLVDGIEICPNIIQK